MVRISLWLTLLLAAGCSHKNYNVADPVVGPAPPRDFTKVAAQSEALDDIRPVAYQADEPLSTTAVVARVNGRPILAGEILEQYSSRLAKARPQMSDRDYRKAQETLIQRDLPKIIEQSLMANSVKARLKKDQLEQIDSQLDVFFEQEVDRLKAEFKVNSTAELEALLQEQGMSLASMRKQFGERQLAQEYVRAKMGSDPPLSRAELLAEYNARKEEFAEPALVKWQQLQLTTVKYKNLATAQQTLQTALEELDRGVSFEDVVKKYSDGPLAAQGGHWDWMQTSSIANAELRKALDTMPLNQLSPVIRSPNSVQIVRVLGRKPAGYQPFGDVQESIRKRILEERRVAKAQTIIDDLMQAAMIETMFDDGAQQMLR